jgi:hypothetical protein
MLKALAKQRSYSLMSDNENESKYGNEIGVEAETGAETEAGIGTETYADPGLGAESGAAGGDNAGTAAAGGDVTGASADAETRTNPEDVAGIAAKAEIVAKTANGGKDNARKPKLFPALPIAIAAVIAAAATAFFLAKPEPASAEAVFFDAINGRAQYAMPLNTETAAEFYGSSQLGQIAGGLSPLFFGGGSARGAGGAVGSDGSGTSDAGRADGSDGAGTAGAGGADGTGASEATETSGAAGVETELELSAWLAPALHPDQYASIIEPVLADLAVSVSSKTDYASQKAQTSVAVNLSGQKLASLDVLYDGEGRIGVSSKEIHPSPVFVSLGDFPQLMAAATGQEPGEGAAIAPLDSLQKFCGQLLALPDAVSLTREEFDAVAGPYFDLAQELLPDGSFALTEGASVPEISGKSYDKVSLLISDADLKALAIAMIERARDDAELFSLLQRKYQPIYDLCSSALDDFGSLADGAAASGASLPSPAAVPDLAKAALLSAQASVTLHQTQEGRMFGVDIYLDGSDVMCLNVYSAAPDGTRTGADFWYKNYLSPGGSVQYVDISASYDLPGGSGASQDSAGAAAGSVGEEPERAAIEIMSAMSLAGGSGESGEGVEGSHVLEVYVDIPASMRQASPAAIWRADRSGGEERLSLSFGERRLGGGEPAPGTDGEAVRARGAGAFVPYAVLRSETRESDGGGFGLTAEMSLYDPSMEPDAAAQSGAVGAGGAQPGSPGAGAPIATVSVSGSVKFGAVDIPDLDYGAGDAVILTPESFDDGTFEALAADVGNGVTMLAFSNLQLISRYVNLQDLY